MISNFISQPLIPGLPDDVAMHCLIHLPFPYHFLTRSVSSTWNHVLSSSVFLRSKSVLPHLFIFAFDHSNLFSQWQSLDPRSLRWFILPPMPSPPDSENALIFPPASAFAMIPRSSKLFVLGGFRCDTNVPLQSVMMYHAGTNSWSVVEPMSKPRSFFSAGVIDGREILIVGGEVETNNVERWEPGGKWQHVAGMGFEAIGRYDVAVIGSRIYMMEGWPYNFTSQALIYDWKKDDWEEMREGMRKGWTGLSVVTMGKLFSICELDDPHVKVYDEDKDSWYVVNGGGILTEMHRPLIICGSEEGTLYVVGKGLDVAMGEIVAVEEGCGWKIEWNVVKGPLAFSQLTPCCSLILYA